MYTVIYSRHLEELEVAVNEALEEGYICVGGMSVITEKNVIGEVYNDHTYYQAMLKEVEPVSKRKSNR